MNVIFRLLIIRVSKILFVYYFLASVFSGRKGSDVQPVCLCAPSPPVFPASDVCIACSSWCGGSARAWRIHPSAERVGSVDTPVIAHVGQGILPIVAPSRPSKRTRADLQLAWLEDVREKVTS